ncbi:MAG: hypothetical protein QW590_01705 [Candidatus Bilamarchaeaceae archaeon]
MKKVLAFALLFSLAFSQGLLEEAEAWQLTFQVLLGSVVMASVMIAAVAYVMSGMFGAEMRASIQGWAHGLLAAGGISLIILILVNILVPQFRAGVGVGGGAAQAATLNAIIEGVLRTLLNLSIQALAILMILLVVIAAAVYLLGQMFGAETRARASTWAQLLISSAILAAALYTLITSLLPETARAIIAAMPISREYSIMISYIITLVGIVVLITYLASKVFKVPEWEAYLTIEFTDLLTSLLIIMLVVGMFSVGTEVARAIGKEAGYANAKTPPHAAIMVVSKIIRAVEDARTDAYIIQSCTSILSTFHKRTGESALNMTYKIFPGIDFFVSAISTIATALVMLEATLKVQLLILQGVEIAAPLILLPAGILLRFFPPTRDAGAFLLSLAIGFYVILPLTYVINEKIIHDELKLDYNRKTALRATLCGFDLFASTIPLLAIPQIVGVFSSTLAGLFHNTLSLLFSQGGLLIFKVSEFMVILDSIAVISLIGFFAPAISMVITVAFINALTRFIVMRG